jgi:apolipoprotein N-acyltransferase
MAELGGEPLADACVALAGCGIAAAAFRFAAGARRWRVPLAAGLAALLLPLVYGLVRLPQVSEARAAAPRIRVGVVQPNVGILEKRNPDLRFGHLRQLRELTRDLELRGAELVVWPETAYPFPIPRTRTHDSTGPAQIVGGGVRGPVLAGAITFDDRGHRYNSAVLVARDGRLLGISDKVQLLAFGEYVPLWDYIPPLQERFHRGLTPGDRPRVLECEGVRLAVLNCYEDVLAGYGLRVAQDDPGFLVNVTNDAWFGDTSEPWLHQSMARLRSIETRRDLVRAVNTGVSSHTLATGEDAIRTATWEPAAFVADVRLMSGKTPWVRLGDLTTPLAAGALLGAALAFFVTARRRARA